MAQTINLRLILTVVKAEADIIVNTLRDKGAKRFANVIALAGVLLALAYFGVYKPPQDKILRLARDIEKTRAMFEAGAQYRELRDQLAAAYAALPSMPERDQWLASALIESLRAENLTPDTIRPVSETEASGLIFQSSTIQLTIQFSEFHRWLIRLERAKPLMHVFVVDMTKKLEPLGANTITCEVMTVIPKKRFN